MDRVNDPSRPPLPPGYGASPGDGLPPARLVSAGLPPGYGIEQAEGGEPQVLLYFRLYSGLLVLSGLGVFVTSLLLLLKHNRSGSFGVTFLLFGVAWGAVAILSHLLGVLAPRRPWMHVVGTVIIGLGLVTNGCWLINIPLLIFWLKPEVQRWFQTAPP